MWYDDGIATFSELIASLSRYDPTRDAEGHGTPPTDPPVIWLGADEQAGYLIQSTYATELPAQLDSSAGSFPCGRSQITEVATHSHRAAEPP